MSQSIANSAPDKRPVLYSNTAWTYAKSRISLTLSAYSVDGGEWMAKEEIAHVAPPAPAMHAVQMENRERLMIGGVQDVAGFDENMVVLSTALGDLTVRGEGLHIEKIDLEAGRLELHGKLTELSYDEPAPSGGWWSKLFG